jgi:hypothetical protein
MQHDLFLVPPAAITAIAGLTVSTILLRMRGGLRAFFPLFRESTSFAVFTLQPRICPRS